MSRILAALTALSVLAAACGGGDSADEAEPVEEIDSGDDADDTEDGTERDRDRAVEEPHPPACEHVRRGAARGRPGCAATRACGKIVGRLNRARWCLARAVSARARGCSVRCAVLML